MSLFSALKKASAAILDDAASNQERAADLAESRGYRDLDKLDRLRDNAAGIKNLAQDLRDSAKNSEYEDD